MKKKKRILIHQRVFYILLATVIILGGLNIAQGQGLFIPAQPLFSVAQNTVNLNSMTIEQKVAQMVVVGGHFDTFIPWRNMQVGGIHMFALETEHIFNNTIIDFQYGSPINFFVTADLEGCVTPFASIRNFTPASEIDNIGAAFEKGFREGAFLKRLGFNLNFAPVVDLEDQIWKCRTFQGNERKIAELAQAYTLGLQNQGVIASAKHYPGKTLVAKDPHKFVVAATIDKKDLFPYKYLINKGDIGSVMVTHIIATGEIDSEGIPSVVSKKVIDGIKEDYDGLIISDEIHMLGLKDFFGSLDEMYVGVYKAGNDVILNFDRDPNEVHRMIEIVSAAVKSGEIPKKQIDESVRKILVAKGYKVK
jgi:beta-N-acetylhexosaminidase